jgi:hypothetical protein
MHERSGKSVLRNFIYMSPILPVVFIAIFALFMLAQFVRIPLISSLGPTPLAISNLTLLLLVALRFLWYSQRARRNLLQYDADQRPGNDGVVIDRSVDQARTDFADAGYYFDSDGRYGEKRNFSQLGITLLYGGLLLALLVGSFDYVRQYSGAVFQGVGLPMSLSDRRGYFSVVKGPLASTSGLPQLQVKKQILPNREWPKGATEIALLSKDHAVLATGTVGASGGEPLRYGGYEYHFNRFLYDVMFAIKTAKGYVEFDDMIKLQPMDHPEGNYTFSSRFKGERYRWNALFDPERMALRLIALDQKGAQVVDGVIVFQKEPTKKIGGFDVQFSAMSHWSEMHIVHARHMYLLVFGLLITLAGGLMRLIYRPQRIWLEMESEGCRVWTIGKEALHLATLNR